MSKNQNSDKTSTVPIKVVGSKNLLKQVTKGDGLCTAIVAILEMQTKNHGGAKKPLRDLLD